MDQVVAVAADHEGLAADLSHELGPFGLRLAGPVEDGQRADVVNRDVVRSLAELASSIEQPGDQPPVGVDRPGVGAVGEHRVLLPLESLARRIRRQWQPAAKGGPEFVIVDCMGLGSLKVLERFSLTQGGWRNAWHALVRQDPDAAGKVRIRLNEREREQRELDQRFGQTTELVEANPRSFGARGRGHSLAGTAGSLLRFLHLDRYMEQLGG